MYLVIVYGKLNRYSKNLYCFCKYIQFILIYFKNQLNFMQFYLIINRIIIIALPVLIRNIILQNFHFIILYLSYLIIG